MGKMVVNGVSYSGGAENLNELHDVNITSPTTGDVVKWDPTSQKWINGEGGGGNVDDVTVNGVSVLDTNKIAQIKSYKEVTQAEYDALPDTKLSDDILYCITDQATADTTVAPIIYSEDEREVGVWVDGKPLYEKTFVLTSSLTISTDWINTGFYISDAEKIISCEAIRIDSRGSWCLHAGISPTQQIQLSVYGMTTITLSEGSSITLQYTKTTDQPGSGKWAPSGVPAVHYSTEEQIVGTWIDGSPLYEKTVSIPTGSVTGGSFHRVCDISNLNLQSITAYIIEDGSLYVIPNAGLYIRTRNNELTLYCASGSSWNISGGYTILQYTKTSS